MGPRRPRRPRISQGLGQRQDAPKKHGLPPPCPKAIYLFSHEQLETALLLPTLRGRSRGRSPVHKSMDWITSSRGEISNTPAECIRCPKRQTHPWKRYPIQGPWKSHNTRLQTEIRLGLGPESDPQPPSLCGKSTRSTYGGQSPYRPPPCAVLVCVYGVLPVSALSICVYGGIAG